MVKSRRARRRARAKRRPADVIPRSNRGAQPVFTAIDEAFQLDPAAPLPQRAPVPPPEPLPDPAPVATQPLPAELTYPRPFIVEEQTGGKDDTALTAELAAKLLEIPACRHCGGRHERACPRVKSMRYHPNGALAEVTFWPSGKWSDDHIIWPEDLAAAE